MRRRRCNTVSKSKMISRRQEGDDEAYFTYVEEAGDDANKDSALIWNWNKYILLNYNQDRE
jgi:hypothetical protein